MSHGPDQLDKDTQKDSGNAKEPSFALWILALAGMIAIAAVAAALLRNDDNPSDTVDTGQAAQAPSVETVISQLESRLQDKPDDAEGWQLLGWSYFETERFAEAATALKRATSLAPDIAEYHSMLGEALVLADTQGNIPDDARGAFATAVRLNPKDPRARYFLAAAKDLDGKPQEAIDDWFALLADTPANAPWAQDIRRVIENVGKLRNIDVAERLASAEYAEPSNAFVTDGANIASAAIPGPTQEQMQAAANLPPGQQEAMITGMVDGLANRLKDNPNDSNGWIMLMRSYIQLNEPAKAGQALKDARMAFADKDAELRKVSEAAKTLGVPGS